MKLVTYLKGPQDLPYCQGIDEVVISPSKLARMGQGTLNECLELAKQCRQKTFFPLSSGIF